VEAGQGLISSRAGWLRAVAGVMDRGISVEMQDTSAEAAEVLAGVHRRLSGPRKVLIACQMSDSVREMARTRIRARMPDLDENSVREQLIWELYGVRRQR
jgi:hypothetical protein